MCPQAIPLKLTSQMYFFKIFNNSNILKVIPLKSAWVMTSAFSPSGNLVACGGMDNMLTMYNINSRFAMEGNESRVITF